LARRAVPKIYVIDLSFGGLILLRMPDDEDGMAGSGDDLKATGSARHCERSEANSPTWRKI
jgi:hypothetical protein